MILLDTHTILWMGFTTGDMSKRALRAIQQAEAEEIQLAASVASIYEIAYGLRRGRIVPTIPQDAFLSRIREKIRVFPITNEIAITAAQIAEPFHGDPMDRLIVATAIHHNCTLVTGDRQILRANVCKTLW